MADDVTTRCIEACLELSSAAADAASHCLAAGGEYAHGQRVNALVTCSAVTRMIAERLQLDQTVEGSLLVLGVEVAQSAERICTELGDPELQQCVNAAGACAEALRTIL